MHTVTRQGVQEYRQGCHEGLTFTSCHLGNLTLMKYYTAEELHIVMHHFPFQVVTAGSPVIMVDGLVTVDGDKVLLRICSQLTVKVRSGYDGLFILGKSAGSLLDDGKHLGHHLVECLLVDVKHFLLDFVYLRKDFGTLVDGRVFDGSLELCNLGFLCAS